jgi:acyl-CoA thioester hydrolase
MAVKLVLANDDVETFDKTAHRYIPPMYSHQTTLRVRYAETDRMGYVYYGTYAQYFEVGRVEALRSLGMSYRRMEEEGLMLPVHDLSVRFHKPAFYDDLLTVRTTIGTMPSVRIRFDYEVRNEEGVLLTEAATTLVFIDRATNRPCRAPAELLEKLAPYFET